MTEKLMPIEPGCLCVITTGSNAGKTVTAVRSIGEKPFRVRGDDIERARGWEMDRYLEAWNGELTKVVQERRLMRIDGGDFSRETEQAKVAG